MSITNPVNVPLKPAMDIKDNSKHQEVNTAEVKETKKEDDVVSRPEASPSIKVSQYPTQSQTRNLRFKVNEDSKEMYIEVTNSDNEVVRTIPFDENDPKFVELIKKSTPGMIINDKG